MSQRLHIRTAAFTLGLVLVGCQAGPRAGAEPIDAAPANAGRSQPRLASATRPAEDGHGRTSSAAPSAAKVALPPGLTRQQVAPLTGDALEKARRPLIAVLEASPTPDYLARPHTQASQPATQTEAATALPLAAQKAYAKARYLIRTDRPAQALDRLETARRLAPKEPAILKLLGRVWLASGNQVRGAHFLTRALQQNPDLPRSLFLLGRFAMEQGEWGKAITLLHRTIALTGGPRQVDPALEPLSHYYLAVALKNQGFATASLEQFHQYLDQPRLNRRPTGLGQQLAFTDQQRGRTWRIVGDLNLRLGEPEKALRAYRQASEAGVRDKAALVRRRVYALLRTGRTEPAVQQVARLLKDADADGEAITLVKYLKAQGVEVGTLADRLRTLYATAGRRPEMALAIAAVLPSERGQALLRKHLDRRPQDLKVYEHLVRRYVPDPSRNGAKRPNLQAAARLAAALMHARPSEAHRYAIPLLQRVQQFELAEQLIQAIPKGDAAEHRSALLTLKGLAYEAAGRADAALKALRQASEADPALPSARLERARLLLNDDQLEAAHRVLEPLAEDQLTSPRAITLRVTVLQRMGKPKEALALLNRLIEQKDRAPVNLLLQKATLLRRQGKVAAAIGLLQDALNARPKAEPLYAALFQLLNSEDAPADAAEQYQRLLQRLMRQLPHSRTARMKRARFLTFREEYGQAIGLLKQVLANHPEDWEALGQLLMVYHEGEQPRAALDLLEKKLQAHPNERELLMLARQFYQQIEDNDRLRQVTERLLKQQPAGAQRDRILAGIYFATQRWEKAAEAARRAIDADPEDPAPAARLLWRALVAQDKPDVAVRRLEQLIDRRPNHAVALRYQLSMVHQFLGQDAEAARLLQKNLEQAPDHVPTQNGLAYFWAERGENLQKALNLVRKALAEEPETAAYLDTRGWVLYKLGRFEQALDSLKQARARAGGRHPVIANHLGDTHHRLGNIDQAIDAWKSAQQMLQQQPDRPLLDPDVKHLPEQIQAKLDSLSESGSPSPAPVTATQDNEANKDKQNSND